MMGSKTGRKDIKNKKPRLKKNPHNNKKKAKTKPSIMETTIKREQELGNITTQTLCACHNQCKTQVSMEFRNSMLLTRFEPLRGLKTVRHLKK